MMAMNRFSYASATSVDEAIDALGEGCRPLAGGTDLLNMIKAGLQAPERLVDIKRVPGLAESRVGNGALHIGALTPLSLVGALAAEQGLTCLAQAIARTASPQIRHMGTLGGNLLQRPRCWYFRNPLTHCLRKGGRRCFAYRGESKYHAILGGGPCYIVHPSDPAVALLALGASLALVGSAGARALPLSEFFLLPKQDAHSEVALAKDELLTEIVIPMPTPGSRGTYVKVAERGSWDFALLSAAVQVDMDGETVNGARIALGGVAPVPWRAAEAEAALVGKPLDEVRIAEAVSAATAGARPLARNRYKVDLAQGVVKQALEALEALG